MFISTLCAQPTINFQVHNLQAGPATGSWMFDNTAQPFVHDGVLSHGEYAYTALTWNSDGSGIPGNCTGSGAVTSATCSAENTNYFNDINGITARLDNFQLQQFHHINTVNPNLNWAILGQAGDERIYGGGTGQIYLNGAKVLSLVNCRITMVNTYPAPVGAGNSSSASGWGFIDPNPANSDPNLVAELDPNGTGQVEFVCASFSPIIQSCYGAYDVTIQVKPAAHVEAMAAQHVGSNGAVTVNLTTAKTKFDLASSVNGGMSGDADYISSNMIKATPAGTLPSGIVAVANCYWQLGTTLQQFQTDVTFDISEIPGIQDVSALRILKRPTGSADWQIWGTISMSDASHIKAGNVSSFSEFTIATVTGNPLPVELQKFTAAVQGTKVVLNWVTATEINNAGFEVERRHDAENWVVIGNVTGHGNSNSPISYSFSDAPTASETPYSYRLGQKDKNGSTIYSSIVSAKILTKESLMLAQNFPNPFNPTTTISYSLAEAGHIRLEIFGIDGRFLKTLINEMQGPGKYAVEFDGANLPSGIYFCKLSTPALQLTRKMIMVK